MDEWARQRTASDSIAPKIKGVGKVRDGGGGGSLVRRLLGRKGMMIMTEKEKEVVPYLFFVIRVGSAPTADANGETRESGQADSLMEGWMGEDDAG